MLSGGLGHRDPVGSGLAAIERGGRAPTRPPHPARSETGIHSGCVAAENRSSCVRTRKSFRSRAAWVAALLAGRLLLVAASWLPAHAEDARPNVVLVTLDTTRADHLGVYGYARETSARLDAFAKDCLVFDRAYSTSSWTLPAHGSLFTGRFPSSHGAHYDETGTLVLSDAVGSRRRLGGYRASPLAAGQHTLAERLADAGYTTGAIVAGPWLKRVFGLDLGFSSYDDENITSVTGRLAADVSDAAVAWLDRNAERPFLLFLNYFDPHGPYDDPDRLASEFLDGLYPRPKKPSALQEIAYYDGEIRYMDLHFGRVVDRLRALGIYDRTLVIVTADHGELLGENGLKGHGVSLREGELRVPMLVKYAGVSRRAGRSDDPVQLTDVAPMILHELGLEAGDDLQGGVPPEIGHPIYAEVYPLKRISKRGHWRAIFDGSDKYLWNSHDQHLLFDLAVDPTEASNLVDTDPERARAMQSQLDAFSASLQQPSPDPEGSVREIDDETRRALEGLGYIGTGEP